MLVKFSMKGAINVEAQDASAAIQKVKEDVSTSELMEEVHSINISCGDISEEATFQPWQ